MIKYFLLIAAGLLLITASGEASARPMSYSIHHWYQSPERNVRLSWWYDHRLSVDAGFRAYRMRKECGPIDDPALHADCLASFDQYEPVAAGYGYYRWHRWHRWHHRYYR